MMMGKEICNGHVSDIAEIKKKHFNVSNLIQLGTLQFIHVQWAHKIIITGTVPFVATPLKGRFVVFLKWLFVGYFILG